MENEDYGHITIGHGTLKERRIKIDSFVFSFFKDGRKISVIKTKEMYAFIVENHESSDRAKKQEMLLTPESFFGLLSVMSLIVQGEGIDYTTQFKNLMNTDKIEYEFSNNLKLNL